MGSLDYFKGNKSIKLNKKFRNFDIVMEHKPRLAKEKIDRLVRMIKNSNLSKSAIAKKVGCSVTTVERYTRWLKKGDIYD